MATPFVENRKYPRRSKNVRLRLEPAKAGFDLVGETINLSSNGALCKLKKAIPEMTVLKMILKLPEDFIEFEGTAVRVEGNPSENGSYNVAIYFNEISEYDRKKLSDFIGT